MRHFMAAMRHAVGVTLLVVLGAGASRDAVNEYTALSYATRARTGDWRPPLTAELFEPRPTFGAILAQTRRALDLVVDLRARLQRGTVNLEQELDKVQDRAEAGDENAAIRLMALRFYLREVLSGCSEHWPEAANGATNYHWLVGRLDEWARDHDDLVVYVTFNYDTMLELAFGDILQEPIRSLDTYVSHPRAHVYKVHGSVNWGQKTHRVPPFTDDERSWVINSAATLPAPGPIEMRTNWSSGVQGEAWVPALAVPIESKSAFVLPDHHRERLVVDLQEVDRVLVVGWRATEQHFLKLVADHVVKDLRGVVVACNNRDESRATALALLSGRGAVRGQVSHEHDLGFSDLVGHEIVEHLLGP